MAHEAERTVLLWGTSSIMQQVQLYSCPVVQSHLWQEYLPSLLNNNKKSYEGRLRNSRMTLQREFSGHVLAFWKARYTVDLLCVVNVQEKNLHKICNKLFIEFNEVWKKPVSLKSFIEKFKNRRKMFQYKR